MKFEIEKDKTLKCFIVWEIHTNYRIDRFRGLKRECKQWIQKHTK